MKRIVENPRGINPKDAYELEDVKNYLAVGQITYAYRTFELVRITKNINELKVFIESLDYLDKEKRFQYLKDNDFLFYRVFDVIKIGIVFENFFKAKLLLNDYLIHKINHKEKKGLKEIAKEQNARPIDKKEIREIIGNHERISDYLSDNTISYSTILNKKNYYRIFMVDNAVVDFLKGLNKERNKLHLLYSETIVLSKKEVELFEKIIDLVKYDISYLQRTLLEKLDPDSKSKIPLKF